MTAITEAFAAREPEAPTMPEEVAVATILEGHRAGVYVLPSPVVAAAEGAAAIEARANEVHHELIVAAAALADAPGRLVAELVRVAATTGRISKTDVGGVMILLEADVARLRHEDRVLQIVAGKVEAYPATIARSLASDVHAALDTALTELRKAALPHSRKIAEKVDPAGRNPLVAALRLDPAGTAALEALTGRLLALEAASAAMARLGRPWPGLDGAPTGEPVIRLARLSVGTPSES